MIRQEFSLAVKGWSFLTNDAEMLTRRIEKVTKTLAPFSKEEQEYLNEMKRWVRK